MSELISTKVEPSVVYLKNYQVPTHFIDEIHLYIDLFESGTTVKSCMTVRKNEASLPSSNSLRLEGEKQILLSAAVDGVFLTPEDYQLSDSAITFSHLPDQCELEIITRIYPEKNTELTGLYRSQKTYCTQCEAEGFRRITYFLDHPDVLARYTTTISAPVANYPYLLSNGNLIAQGVLPDERHFVKWEDPFKKPSYLFALVAGDFDLLEDIFITQSNRKVILRIFVEKGQGSRSGHAMVALKTAMRWDEVNYGREYDLDIYMIVAIHDFNMGAMENKGLNIFNTKYILAEPKTATDDDYIHILSVVAHEYFHNWSGNRVTCRDWFQLSLKEGLTIFRDQSFSEDTISKSVMRIHDVNDLREVQFAEDAGPLAHPVRPDSYIEINNFYTATVYNKGAEVLRMMETILGKALFRQGMDLYFTKYDGQAVTIEDFVGVMETVSGVDFTQFRRWYSQSGTPVLTVTDEYDDKQNTYALTLSQSCPRTSDQVKKLPLCIPVRMALLDSAGQDMLLHLEDEAPQSEKILQVKQDSQTFYFKNVASRPVPSLLRNFSAPVKLDYAYSEDDLIFLSQHDTDLFNRYEAGQQYYLRVILRLVKAHQENKIIEVPKSMFDHFNHLLQQETQDLFYLSEMLKLPSEKYISEQMDVIDVDAIHFARQTVTVEMAKQLKKCWRDKYNQYQNQDNSIQSSFDLKMLAIRQFKNRCLYYLMHLPEGLPFGVKQFETSLKSNMTDTLAALAALNNCDSPERSRSLDQFYAAWKQEALVLDKWFTIHAVTTLPSALAEVKALSCLDSFDIRNPNRVYALLGAFGSNNAINFHAKGGASYVFLREKIQELDRLNPQIAARMVKPLTVWHRYDIERQDLMREQLALLLQEKTSTDLYEMVTKSLKET